MNLPGDIPKLINSELGQMAIGIFKDYLVPYAQRKITSVMNPVEMTKKEQEQQAQEEFATVDDFDIEGEAEPVKTDTPDKNDY